MKPRRSAAALGLTIALALAPRVASADPPPPKIDIPFTKLTLPNGLTVILHEDHALPLVVVNTMVKVGSRFEDKGRTGFAHLFEHLMFMGTRRVPTKMFDTWMEGEGGWNNAWTSEDRTDYFDVAPSHALPLLLWLEADRFASIGAEMTLDKLNAQRDVVRNERRQTSENTPYGKGELRLPELLYPVGHPYHHPIIGSHDDLQAATVDDVKSFFARWYVPNNCSLVIAGDFDPGPARAAIERMFGALAKSDVPAAPQGSTPKLAGVTRETITDNVELPKIVMAWHSPASMAPGDAEMDLLSIVLREGKASRLYKALVYDTQLAQEVSAEQRSNDLSSMFVIEAMARPGVSLAKLERAIDKELKKVLAAAPTDAEIARAKNQFEAGFLSKLQSVQARATLLNQYQMKVGDPGYVERDLKRYRDATAASVYAAVKQSVTLDARVIMTIVPKEDPSKRGAKKGGKK